MRGFSADDIVLVTAASSSAALGGLQIAKNAGAQVIAVTRKAEKADFLLGAGADHVVATEEEDLASRVMAITGGQGFTIAYDPVGGAFIGDLVAAAQPYSLIVNYGNLRTEPIDIPGPADARQAAASSSSTACTTPCACPRSAPPASPIVQR